MHGSHVFWVDSDTEMMYRTDKNGKEKAVEVHGKFRNLADVQAVNRARRNGKASLKAICYEICLGLIPRLCGPKVHPLPAFPTRLQAAEQCFFVLYIALCTAVQTTRKVSSVVCSCVGKTMQKRGKSHAKAGHGRTLGLLRCVPALRMKE